MSYKVQESSLKGQNLQQHLAVSHQEAFTNTWCSPHHLQKDIFVAWHLRICWNDWTHSFCLGKMCLLPCWLDSSRWSNVSRILRWFETWSENRGSCRRSDRTKMRKLCFSYHFAIFSAVQSDTQQGGGFFFFNVFI